jgi:hypothetical protein
MSKSVRIAVAAALLLGGASLATAKTRGGPARTAIHLHPGINETTSRPTVSDPYYRLSEPYYGRSDPLQGLFDFYAVPPLRSRLQLRARETGMAIGVAPLSATASATAPAAWRCSQQSAAPYRA